MTIAKAEDSFWANVSGGDFTECWIWTGPRTPSGYGQYWTGTRNVGAHRWAYEDMVDLVPRPLQLDHLCSDRSCVNPWHLEPVTASENMKRAWRRRGEPTGVVSPHRSDHDPVTYLGWRPPAFIAEPYGPLVVLDTAEYDLLHRVPVD